MCHTGNPEPFMIHDTEPDAQSQVTVFASRQALGGSWPDLLHGAWKEHLIAAASCIYTQLYIIRAELGTTVVSCVYGLWCSCVHSKKVMQQICRLPFSRFWTCPLWEVQLTSDIHFTGELFFFLFFHIFGELLSDEHFSGEFLSGELLSYPRKWDCLECVF